MVTRRQSSKFKSQSSRSRSKVKSFKIILINSKLHTHDSSNNLNIIDVTKGQRSGSQRSKLKVISQRSIFLYSFRLDQNCKGVIFVTYCSDLRSKVMSDIKRTLPNARAYE